MFKNVLGLNKILINLQARDVKRCMNTHEECMAYEILNREVSDSLDPQDPEFQQVQVQIRHIYTYMEKNVQEGWVVKVFFSKNTPFLIYITVYYSFYSWILSAGFS